MPQGSHGRFGNYYEWTSTTENNNGARVDVFYCTSGDPSDPKILLVHGFPTSSFDFHRMIPYLQDDYFIAALDFPAPDFPINPRTGSPTCWQITPGCFTLAAIYWNDSSMNTAGSTI